MIDFVTIGCKVNLTDLEDHTEEIYFICFPEESNPDENKISFLSPMGQQLLLAKEGQTLTIKTPGYLMSIRVSKVSMDTQLIT